MTLDLITPRHLCRKAVIYIRQSTPHQVLTNQESLRLQYALRQRACDLGWNDADLLGGRELLKTAVYRLRTKLETAEPGAEELIRSVRGVGYVFDPDGADGSGRSVTEPSPSAPGP